MKVREAMTPDVRLVKPNQPISEAARLMAELDIGALPVEENDRLVGMITDRDIAVRAVAAGRGPDTPVSDVMSRDIKYCYEDQSIDGGDLKSIDEHARRFLVRVVVRERAKVGEADEHARRGLHRVEVERFGPRRDEPGLGRLDAIGSQAQPVGVVATQRREPGIETRRRPHDVTHPDIRRQQPRQPTHQRGELCIAGAGGPRVGVRDRVHRDVDVGDLWSVNIGVEYAFGGPAMTP